VNRPYYYYYYYYYYFDTRKEAKIKHGTIKHYSSELKQHLITLKTYTINWNVKTNTKRY